MAHGEGAKALAAKPPRGDWWRPVSSWVDGRGFAEVAQGLESNHLLSPPIVRCPVPPVPPEQARADVARRPALTPRTPRTRALGEAAGDP